MSVFAACMQAALNEHNVEHIAEPEVLERVGEYYPRCSHELDAHDIVQEKCGECGRRI